MSEYYLDKDYIILTGTNSAALSVEVTQYLNAGYKLAGGLVSTLYYDDCVEYAQAVIHG